MKNIVLTFVNYFNFVACYFDHRFQLNTALGATQNVLFGNGKFIDAHNVRILGNIQQQIL